MIDFFIRQIASIRNNALLNGLFDNFLTIQASSIIFDGDANIPPIMIRMKADRAFGGFPLRQTLFRRFQPMVGRIPDQMRQRIANRLDQGFIQFGFFTGHHQLDLLPAFAGQIANQPRKSMKGTADRHHPDRHHAFLKLPSVALQLHNPFL